MTNTAQLQPQSDAFFSTIIAGLHESRRLDAIKVMHRYRHLDSDRVQINPCDSMPAPHTKAGQILNNGRDKNVKRLIETYLTIFILLGFGVVHMIGGVLIQRASTQHRNPPLAVVAQGD